MGDDVVRFRGPRGLVELRVVAPARARPPTRVALRHLAVELADATAGPVGLTRMRALLARVDLPAALDGEGVDRQLAGALSEGLLRVDPLRNERPAFAPGGASEARDGSDPPPSTSATRTWIAIQLIEDRDPPRPMGHARYRIELTDGSVREGRLDASGLARFDDLDPGLCHVSFPDFDGSATSLRAPPSGTKRPVESGAVTSAGRPPPPPRCRAVGLDTLEATGRASHRRVGGERVLQVVPVPDVKSTAEFGMPFTLKGTSELVDVGKEMGHLLGQWRKKGRRAFFDDLRAAGRPARPDDAPRNISFRIAGARYTGGDARVYAKLRCSSACTAEHGLSLRAPDGAVSSHRPREALLLRHAEADLGERSVPSVYELSGRGCEGEPVALSVEVFPSAQRIFTGAVEVEVQRQLMGRITGWLEALCGVHFEAEASVEGALESFEGWRQDDREWTAYWCQQYGLRFTIKGRIEASVSLLQVGWRVPEAAREFLGDVVLFGGLEPSVSFDLSQEARRLPGPGRRRPAEGSPQPVTGGGLKGSLGVTLGGRATVGSTKLLGVSVTASAKSELSLSGRAERESGRVKIEPAGELSETRGSIQVLGKALLWKTEPAWDWTWLPAASWRPEEPILLGSEGGPS